MRILYVNICEERAFSGHRLFDVEWAEGLSAIGKVDLIQPHDNWFKDVSDEVNVLTYEYNTKNIEWLNKGIFKKGILKRLDLYIHVLNGRFYRYLEKLDEMNNYDVIVAAHIDYLMYNFMFWNSRLTRKIFLIEHSPVIYLNMYYKWMCKLYKNRIHHIIMEKAAIPFYINELHISDKLLHYIPHPLNVIESIDNEKTKKYNIVALSNSNSDDEIQRIIDYEKTTSFFRENGISVLIRSKQIEYDDGVLKVFAGRLSLPFEKFYGYVLGSDIVLLPFGTDFGARTSGTIIDGLSNRKPVIGTGFETMVQYERDYPYVCKSYRSMSDMIAAIKLFNGTVNNMNMNNDFQRFIDGRSAEAMISIYMDVFNLGRSYQ